MCEAKTPGGYEKIKVVDLVANRREATIVNILSGSLLVVMVVIGGFLFGLERLERLLTSQDRTQLKWFGVRLLVICILCALYIVLHEIIHLVFMKLFCRSARLSFGYRLVYAYAGSNAFYTRTQYAVISFAPVLILGVILTAICIIMPEHWVWSFYLIQVLNISGAAGDIYVLALISRMPSDVLIRDSGTAVTIYGKEK